MLCVVQASSEIARYGTVVSARDDTIAQLRTNASQQLQTQVSVWELITVLRMACGAMER